MRRKNCVEINDYAYETYNTNSQIRLKTSILKSVLCDYSDACILVSGTMEVTGAEADHAAKRLDKRNKGVIIKNCVPLTDYISEINNTQVDNAKYLDVAMSVYNLIEHSDNFSKRSGSLWHYCRGDPSDNIAESKSFKFEINIKGKTTTAAVNTNYVKIALPLIYLTNFWRTLKMPLINCEITLILTCSENCVITSANGKQNLQ